MLNMRAAKTLLPGPLIASAFPCLSHLTAPSEYSLQCDCGVCIVEASAQSKKGGQSKARTKCNEASGVKGTRINPAVQRWTLISSDLDKLAFLPHQETADGPVQHTVRKKAWPLHLLIPQSTLNDKELLARTCAALIWCNWRTKLLAHSAWLGQRATFCRCFVVLYKC